MWVRQAFSGQLCSELQAMRRACCKRGASSGLAGRVDPWRRTQLRQGSLVGWVGQGMGMSGAEANPEPTLLAVLLEWPPLDAQHTAEGTVNGSEFGDLQPCFLGTHCEPALRGTETTSLPSPG